MKTTFRKLSVDEIEARVLIDKEKYIKLLLYKDARADMKILDEAVGNLYWTREHKVINNSLFCRVSIYDDTLGQWVYKEDVGTESHTEQEKGQASDSFKRACTNWGIGRELYTAPDITIWKNQFANQGWNWKFLSFKVSIININKQKEITGIQIIETKSNTVVFSWGDTSTNFEKIKILCDYLDYPFEDLQKLSIKLFDNAVIQSLTDAEREKLLDELKSIRNQKEIEKLQSEVVVASEKEKNK